MCALDATTLILGCNSRLHFNFSAQLSILPEHIPQFNDAAMSYKRIERVYSGQTLQ
jgi:hypothetical protein